MDAKQEAKKKWEDRAFTECVDVFQEESYLQGITDYKKSLREAIEKRIKNLKNKKYTHRNMSAYDLYAAEQLEKVIELLDTVTPLNS